MIEDSNQEISASEDNLFNKHMNINSVCTDQGKSVMEIMNSEPNNCFICDKRGEPQDIFIHFLLSHRLLEIFMNENYFKEDDRENLFLCPNLDYVWWDGW